MPLKDLSAKGVPPALRQGCYSRREKIPGQIDQRQTIPKTLEETMTTLQKDTADAQLRLQLDAKIKKYDEVSTKMMPPP